MSGGDLDAGFDASADNMVWAIAAQPDGKVLIGGNFTAVGGVARHSVARLNPDGSLDTGFDQDANGRVNDISLQPDGKVLIGGVFTALGGVPRNNVARLNPDGSLDTGFNPDANGGVSDISLQPDGTLLIGGWFSTVGDTPRNRIARLTADGTLDTGFNSPAIGGSVYALVVEPDGTVLIGGDFTTVGGAPRTNMARLNANGSLAAGFDASAIATQSDGQMLISGIGTLVFDIALQPGGKVLIGGNFTTVGGTPRRGVARLTPDGSLDTGFNPNPNNDVVDIATQPDGKVLIGGGFTAVGGVLRKRVARLHADGSLDPAFNPDANSDVASIALQPDGKVLIGGSFTQVGGITRHRVARLLGGPPIAAPTAVAAVAGEGQAAVTWTGVVGDITAYTATASPGGATCTALAPATTCTVTGLNSGTAYRFTVTAANQFGPGSASAPSVAVTTPGPGVTATVLLPRRRIVSGQSLRIAVRASSTGTAAARSVTACLVLPKGVTVVAKGSALRSGRTLCFRQGDLAPGRTMTSLVTVRAVAKRKVIRGITGSARAAGLPRVQAAPRSVTITPRRG